MIKLKEIEPEFTVNCASFTNSPCPNKATISIYNTDIKSIEISLCKPCFIKLIRGLYRRFNNSLEEFLREILSMKEK